MKIRLLLALASTLAVASIAAAQFGSSKAEPASPMDRIAKLGIDPAQFGAYKRIPAKVQEASVRLEPGVIMLHSVELTG